MKYLIDFYFRVYNFLTHKFEECFIESEEYLNLYSIFTGLGFIVHFIIHLYIPFKYVELPLLRGVAFLLASLLLFRKNFSLTIQKKLFTITVLFNNFIFFSVLLFMNINNPAVMLDLSHALTISVFLLNIPFFVIFLILGTYIGFLISAVFFHQTIIFSVAYGTSLLSPIIMAVYCFCFKKTTEQITKQKINSLRLIGAAIAHELKSPLQTMNMDIDGCLETIPLSYSADISLIKCSMNRVLKTLSILLMNLQDQGKRYKYEKISMKACINDALDNYPFNGDEKNVIEATDSEDFYFIGNKTLMMHVFFNLLKNSLFYVISNPIPRIKIEVSAKNRSVYFTDNGPGIKDEIKRKLFQPFNSSRETGCGVGLSFCYLVIEKQFHGTIKCASSNKNNTFTKFEIHLPYE